MIIWDLVLIMKLLDVGVQPWPIVLMVQGPIYSTVATCIIELYYLF